MVFGRFCQFPVIFGNCRQILYLLLFGGHLSNKMKKIEINISIQYKVMDPNGFRINVALRRPSWIAPPWKNKLFIFKALSTILLFQNIPIRGSAVIVGEKTSLTDGRTDGPTDRQARNIYASNPLGRGIIKKNWSQCLNPVQSYGQM